jgi:hypothetical protein
VWDSNQWAGECVIERERERKKVKERERERKRTYTEIELHRRKPFPVTLLQADRFFDSDIFDINLFLYEWGRKLKP